MGVLIELTLFLFHHLIFICWSEYKQTSCLFSSQVFDLREVTVKGNARWALDCLQGGAGEVFHLWEEENKRVFNDQKSMLWWRLLLSTQQAQHVLL